MTIFVFLFLACSSMHDVGKLLEYDSVRERTQNVQRLNSIAKHESLMDNSSARIMAIKNIGILQPTDQNTLSTLQYLSTHSHPEIRRMSIWSLGEVGRVLEWDEETQNIMVTLQKELLSAPSIKDAQYILESMIKIYCRHVHTVQEDVALVKLLQEYQTKTTNPPDVLYFFEQEIQSLPVLLQILSEKVNDSAQEIYTANMEIFRYLQKNSTTLNHPQYKELVNQTLRAELEQLNSNEIPIQMLGLWILGSTAVALWTPFQQ